MKIKEESIGARVLFDNKRTGISKQNRSRIINSVCDG